MTKTIVGVFDEAAAVQNVRRELLSAGIKQEHVRVLDSNESKQDSDGSWTGKIFSLLSALFEHDEDRKQADNYAEAWRRGHFLVIADVEDNLAQRTAELMNRYGTVDIDRRAEQWKQSGYTGSYDRNAAPYTAQQREQELSSYNRNEQTIPVVQEELAVGKQVVQRGGVRIHSYVKEQPVEERIRLREEHVEVSRRPANRPATEGDQAFKERTVNVTANEEQAVVEKRARVVEEVSVGKDVRQREERVQETLRREDVEVEKIEGAKPRVATTQNPASGPRR